MKKKNVIGALVMAGLVLASVPLGVNRSFARLREDAEGSYYHDDSGYAIYEGLDDREAAANNLLTVARKYADANPELDPAIDDLEYRLDLSTPYGDFAAEARKNDQLTLDFQTLYDALEGAGLSEKDERYRVGLLNNFESAQDKIQRSSYNDDAQEYNARLRKFPVNFLRYVSGVEELGVFGPGSGEDA